MFRSDIWRPGIVAAPMTELVAGRAAGALEAITWLPEETSFRFLADPFGLWRGGKLHVFAERYDYRDRIGTIDVLTFDAGLRLLDSRTCLSESWHLSYPFVIEDGGDTYMLPEASKSGGLTLYRAIDYPHRWEACAAIELGVAPVDASPVFHEGCWWLFYSVAGRGTARAPSLNVAFADALTGPWHPHPLNPVRSDPGSSRPGGTPLVVDGTLVLPVQDCRDTYGGAIRALWIHQLTPTEFQASAGTPVRPPRSFGRFTDGLHTMSAAGPVTLIDAKRIDRSPLRGAINVQRIARRAVRRSLGR